LHYLDGLRGWAALITVIGHVEFWFEPAAAPRGYGLLTDLFNSSPVGVFSYIAVTVFFVISGFALSYPILTSSRPIATVLNMACVRYFRLTIPIVVSTAFAVALYVLGAYCNAEAGDLSGSPWFAQWYVLSDSVPNDTPPGFLLFSLFDVYFRYRSGHQTWNPVLWTMSIELIGSFSLFAVLFAVRWRAVRIALAVAALFYFARSSYFGFAFGYLISRPDRKSVV